MSCFVNSIIIIITTKTIASLMHLWIWIQKWELSTEANVPPTQRIMWLNCLKANCLLITAKNNNCYRQHLISLKQNMLIFIINILCRRQYYQSRDYFWTQIIWCYHPIWMDVGRHRQCYETRDQLLNKPHEKFKGTPNISNALWTGSSHAARNQINVTLTCKTLTNIFCHSFINENAK